MKHSHKKVHEMDKHEEHIRQGPFDPRFALPYVLGEDDSELAQQKALLWVYSNWAGIAYQHYLRVGRGILFGPIPMDTAENPLSREQLITTAATGMIFHLAMAYARREVLPPPDAPLELQSMILDSVKEYDPTKEVNVLFRRSCGSVAFFIGRFGRLGLMGPSPAEYYQGMLRGLSPAEYYEVNRDRINLNRKMRGNN
jgi:hypothetical protein